MWRQEHRVLVEIPRDVSPMGGDEALQLRLVFRRDPAADGEARHLKINRQRVFVLEPLFEHIELQGADDAPGVREGGILEQVTREVNIEALPTDIPESIVVDVSGMGMQETLHLSAVTPPEGVTLLDDLEETVVATITPPRLSTETEDEIEQETAVVGEAKPAAEAEGDTGDAAADEGA